MTPHAGADPNLVPGAEALPAITAMGHIALPELTDAAGLQTRHDRKYLLPTGDLDAAIGSIRDDVLALEIDGARAFPYTSTYFDTADLVSFRTTAHRRRRRFKVRTRRYSNGACFLEVKTRDGRGATVKTRRPHDPAATDALTDDDVGFVHRVLAEQGVAQEQLGPLRPVLSTGYARSTLYLPASGARVTIDRSLTWHCLDHSGDRDDSGDRADRGYRLIELAVAETKSPGAACAVDLALWHCGHRPRALSKYATGMTLLSPELPANRWHRVRHLLAPHLREVR